MPRIIALCLLILLVWPQGAHAAQPVTVLVVQRPYQHLESREYLLREYVETTRTWLKEQCGETFDFNIQYITLSEFPQDAEALWEWACEYQWEHLGTYWVFGGTGGAFVGALPGLAVSGDWTLRLIDGAVPPFSGEGSWIENFAFPFYEYRRGASAVQLIYVLAGGWGPERPFDAAVWPKVALSEWHKKRVEMFLGRTSWQ